MRKSVDPGIGTPLSDALRSIAHSVSPGSGSKAATEAQIKAAAAIISGCGDLFVVFAFLLERLGIEREAITDLLDIAVIQATAGGDQHRAVVPRALRAVLEKQGPRPGPLFDVIEGG